ncbi:hypothetical protein OJF2_07460 [Aquisphaera giovannonii]|uniref:Uncharacterized protein n=1 Tax=Aquisphaera giovannonii TaxID=406548 RepID=A0A5B9VWF4_9BACT|nr:hypothetical protein [Aquisphaera giovannonii]QEH32277.1 hypothetical protein OJF2_07460 [Aquisphaera giovannonii]
MTFPSRDCTIHLPAAGTLMTECPGLSEPSIRAISSSYSQLIEAVRCSRLEASLVRSRLYEILEHIESYVPDELGARRRWMSVRTEIIAKLLAHDE